MDELARRMRVSRATALRRCVEIVSEMPDPNRELLRIRRCHVRRELDAIIAAGGVPTTPDGS